MTAIAILMATPAPILPIVLVFTNASLFTVVPAGYTKYTGEAIAPGGRGFGSNVAGARRSGGGGQYAKSAAQIAVTPGSNIYYRAAGAAGFTSYTNTTNAEPTSSTTGAKAMWGTDADGANPGLGNQAGSVGVTINFGGNGDVGLASNGGGGGGASSAASGQTAGTDTTGLSPATLMGGGNGGSVTGSPQFPGFTPGGGGAAGTATGTNPTGGQGRVRIVFEG